MNASQAPLSKTPTLCLRAELEKMGISTHNLRKKSHLVDAYLVATVSSARPHAPDLGDGRWVHTDFFGRRVSHPVRPSPGRECARLWGMCWQQLRYK